MTPDHLAEALDRGVEVAPCGVQRGVPQKGLQLQHVGAGLEGGRREAVAEGVHDLARCPTTDGGRSSPDRPKG